MTAEYEHIAGNVGSILKQLHAAAPRAQIVVIGNYNPFPAVPCRKATRRWRGFNTILAKTAAKTLNTSFISVEPAFNPSGFFGGIGNRRHPVDLQTDRDVSWRYVQPGLAGS